VTRCEIKNNRSIHSIDADVDAMLADRKFALIGVVVKVALEVFVAAIEGEETAVPMLSRRAGTGQHDCTIHSCEARWATAKKLVVER